MNYWTLNKNNIFVAGHRGWPSAYPENSIEGFKAAADLGIDQLETDVRVTKDGELVLIHDATVDRTSNSTGKVIEMTLSELRELNVNGGKEEFGNVKIPTLIEFMELVSKYPLITIDIELKEYPEPGHEKIAYDVCDRTLKIIDDYGFTDRCVINTFSRKLHDYIQDKYPGKYRQHVYFPNHLTEDEDKPYSYAYCCCMFSREKNKRMATPEEFAWMKAKGVSPWAGAAVRDEEGVDEAISCGTELITCNNPDKILEILRAKGYHK